MNRVQSPNHEDKIFDSLLRAGSAPSEKKYAPPRRSVATALLVIYYKMSFDIWNLIVQLVSDLQIREMKSANGSFGALPRMRTSSPGKSVTIIARLEIKGTTCESDFNCINTLKMSETQLLHSKYRLVTSVKYRGMGCCEFRFVCERACEYLFKRITIASIYGIYNAILIPECT